MKDPYFTPKEIIDKINHYIALPGNEREEFEHILSDIIGYAYRAANANNP